MRLLHGRATVMVAGVAVVVLVGGAAAVQAQNAPTQVPGKVVAGKAAVASHANRFGFGPGQALITRDVISNRLGSVIRFDRTYRGLPVVGGDFIVHLSKSGAFQYANGRKVVGLPSSVKASISAAVARQAAVAKVGYPVAKASAQLAIFTTARSSTLAWAVSTSGRSADKGSVTYVSAGTGKVLASWATVMNDDLSAKDVGVGKTQYSGKVKLPDVKKSKKYELTDTTRGDQSIYNANHTQSQGVGTLFTDKSGGGGDGTETNVETPAADAAYGLANTWDFYLDTFGRKGIADDGKAARGFVHFGTNYVNAFWSDGCFCMEFGDGSQASGISNLTSLDVAGHEMTHGVTSRTAKLIYSGESGGLNESTSDVMGTMVEWTANNKEDVPDYVIGEEIFRNYDPAVNYIRRMDKPSMDGASADCWYDGVGNRDVHYSSGVSNHVFYLLSEGSGKKTINGIKYDSPTCNGKTIKPIGHDAAAAIWYKALTEEWVSTTNFHQARVGMLNAAKALYGKNSVEYKTTDAAWAAVDVKP
jgi:zinc metalloprotease ZmpA